MKNVKKVSKVVAGLFAAAAIVAGTVIGALAFSKTEIEKVVETQIVTVEKNVTVEVPVEVEVITEVEVEKLVEVPVDNGDMDFVLTRLEDMDVIEDADEIVAELKAEDAAIEGAFAFVNDNEDELFDMLEEAGLVDDEDDVEVIKVYDDFEDVVILDSDFDDEEYKFKLLYKVEDTEEEEKLKVLVKVKLEDGEFEILKVEEQ